MCGIAGIVAFDGRPVDISLLERMSRLQRHRGPDGSGQHLWDGVGLAHRRLAIIDPKGGRQPWVDHKAGLALVYNGEIYNYREIRRELGENGFTTDSDTEVLLRAYQRWGIDCLQRFRGMFAFALHDRKQGRVLLVRDRFGIKPLHYHFDGRRLVFASELAPVRAALGAGDIDREAIAGYLHYQYVPSPKTIWRNVGKVMPASVLEFDLGAGTMRQTRYWSLSPHRAAWNESACLDRLDEMMSEIAKLYVRSDVPFGTFLSGGVDSSLVTAYVAKTQDKPVHSFAIGYNDEALSELPWSAQAATVLGTRHHERVLTSDMAIGVLEKIARHFSEPFGDSSAVPTYYVSETAASQVKMVLSGDGGDELFAGYHSYPLLFAQHQRQSGGILDLLGRLLGWRHGAESLQQGHDRHRQIFSPSAVSELVGVAYNPTPPPRLAGAVDAFSQLQFQDLTTYMPDDILTKVDRMSMANSLEVRVPLLDHRLVETAFSLPLEARLQQSGKDGETIGKYIFKALASRFFPRPFVHRRKMGFGIPVQDWLNGPLMPLLIDTLNTPSSPVFDYIDRTVVGRIIEAFRQGRNQNAGQVWCLMMLFLWFGAGQSAVNPVMGEA